MLQGKFQEEARQLDRGLNIQKEHQDSHSKIIGFMRFVAQDIDKVRNLLADNPSYEAGSKIEILEELMDQPNL